MIIGKKRVSHVPKRSQSWLQLLVGLSVGVGVCAVTSAADLGPEPAPVVTSVVQTEHEPFLPASDDLIVSPIDSELQSVMAEATDADQLVVAPVAKPLAELHADGIRDHFGKAHSRQLALGVGAASYSAAPEMIGDFFGGTFLRVPQQGDDSFGGPGGGNLIPGSTVAIAGGDRRFKVAENVSPKPQDRVFFNFNHFENAVFDASGESRSLDRYAFGFEKTFFEGMMSIETRLPVVDALNSKQFLDRADNTGTEFANIALALKVILVAGPNWLVTGGTSATLPTGDDYELFYEPGMRSLLIENDAIHLAPFVGWLVQPNGSWFAQGFFQADFDLRGNDVFDYDGYAGVLQDQNLLFIDASIGRWLFRSTNASDRWTGLAAITELHYTTTMNDTDDVAGVSNPHNRMDILNLAAALHLQFGQSSLRIGGTAPLRDDEESLFESEFIFQLNRNF